MESSPLLSLPLLLCDCRGRGGVPVMVQDAAESYYARRMLLPATMSRYLMTS